MRLIIPLATALCVAAPTSAQMPMCADREAVIRSFNSNLDQFQVWIGLAADEINLELFQSADGRWSLIMTPPGKETCFIAKGSGGRFTPGRFIIGRKS